ncbi:MAG: DNA-binding response OmpR family regulator/anti-sigma regulatory factor (Ser/Thr protein kinase) [Paraglaciecola sp.]|jgi:DNA-binding response OmpR family regulator/anti-sigma regulatory factor (Ser/Thr protein kinase)
MRILVVDNDTLNRFLLVHMLEEQGYVDCYEAENGREAITLAERIKPDLVLLDAILPEMDGFTIAPILKRMAGEIYLPIIFITALDDEITLARCLEVGGDDFAAKPFDKIILAAKIRAHSRTRLLSKKANEQNQQLTYYRNAVEREHKIVEHIFANALSLDDELLSYIDYQFNPASDFNGDLFLMNVSPSGGFYFLIGDFTGHGLASAVGALPVAQAFHTMSKKGLSLMEMAETINEILLILLPVDMFFAAALVEVSQSGKQLNVWNGGMPNLLLINDTGEIIKRFDSRHMALGILDTDEFEYDLERFEASYGDRLIGYSDGVVELTNVQDKMLGDEGLSHWLQSDPNINVLGLMDKMIDYQGNAVRADDVTIASYKCQPLGHFKSNAELSALPFKMLLDLGPEQIRANNPVQDLSIMLTNQTGLFTIHSRLFTVLSELYNNALEHGLLNLDSALKRDEDGFFAYFEQREQKVAKLATGSIKIEVDYAPDQRLLSISVTDSGEGFFVDKNFDLDNNNESFGRGIPLIKELCDAVEYSNNGSAVNVTFKV